ncbi:MAG: PAS domain S-box protein, partial [Rhodoferax sp.]|nr:PAS domain S-box protein [Rhodoferax sp.]
MNLLASIRRLLKRSTVLWATPLLGMIFFIIAMGAFLFVMHRQDAQLTHDTLIRDVEMARQTLRVRLQTTQDRLTQLARDVGQDTVDDTGFLDRTRTLLEDAPELHQIGLMDKERFSRWGVTRRGKTDSDLHRPDERIEDAESYWAFVTAKDSGRPVYSRPFVGPASEIYIELHAPIYSTRGIFQGTVYAAMPINNLLLEVLPKTFQTRYLFNIIDGGGNPVASNGGRSLERAFDAYEVALDPPGQGLRMRAIALITNNRLIQNTLAWVVVGLSLIVIWSFLMLMRHAAARARAEASLLAEAEFRRAVENSVSTGLQVFDLNGRITYVNPAFLRMTGLSENELVGHGAPFPYWPTHHREEQMRNLDMVLSGLAPANGIELKMQRRDAHLFDARMYVSPLINGQGTQTGWMTSITDITEPRRIREELAAAHERFTTVLEEMDAAISVSAPTGKGVRDLLFANRLHRDWFGQCLTDGALGEADLINATGPGVFECYWADPPRWFEVRRRTITWVDGRWVSMDVSTDVTERKQAAESAKTQQEKLQFTSRLVTMGEMASLLAHELNQPLAAISNYSMGSVS